MIHTKSNYRPTCDQILNFPAVQKRIEQFFPEETTDDRYTLIEEIKVPKNLMMLSDRLPGSNYGQNMFKKNNLAKSEQRLPSIKGMKSLEKVEK